MKRIFFCLVTTIVFFVDAEAQVNLTLAFNSRPQPYLADWANSANGRAIITIGQSPVNNAVKLKR